MTGPLASLGLAWEEMIDHTADWQVSILRRASKELADALNHDARAAIEGPSTDWRERKTADRRYQQ